MKRLLVVLGVALAVFSVTLARSGPAMAQESKSDAQLRQLVQDWLGAEERGDVAALRKMFADDFIGTAFGGNIVMKEDVIPQSSGGHRFPKSTLKETVVRVHGTTGVVMGRVAVESAEQPGQFRFTLVCLERDGSWQVVAAHLSRVQPPAE